MPEYNDIVLAARQRLMRSMPIMARKRLAEIYVQEMDSVISLIGRGEITLEQAFNLVDLYELGLRRTFIKSEREIKRLSFAVMRRILTAHTEASAVVRPDLTGAKGWFVGADINAYEALYMRREMGIESTFKTFSRHSAGADVDLLNKALHNAVLKGLRPIDAANQIAAAMSNGDDYVRAAVAKFGSAKGMKRFVGKPKDKAAWNVARRLANDAWRIARTETAGALHEADRMAAVRSPLIGGIKWNLSGRHPEKDVCDLLARLSLHGMGPGVFPPELMPPLAHPHDLCFNTHVLRKAETPQRARTVTLAEAAPLLAGESPRAIARAVRYANRLTRISWESWQKQGDVGL